MERQLSHDCQELIQKVLDALTDLTSLEIVTAVVAANAGAKGLTKADILSESRDIMCSTISLLGGDITTRIPESFVGNGPFQELRAFHLDREKEGHKIIQDNISALKALMELALDADRKAKGTTPPVTPPPDKGLAAKAT